MSTECAWCGAPSVDRVLISPAQYTTVTMPSPKTGLPITAQQASRFAIWADVCADHLDVRDREGGTPVPDKRRRRMAGVDQLDLFGGSTLAPRPPGNAIKGTL